MNKYPAAVRFIAVALMATTFTTSAAYAAVAYKDVPATYWAYDAITAISAKGLIVGDASGNFKPDALIDKFDTAKILAKTAGYKYTNITKAEQNYYDRSYEKNKAILAQYQKTFSKWNASANHEIAFLLEKEILTEKDLDQFVVKDQNGVVQLRALSRQEAAVFLVKLMDKKNEALENSDQVYDFADDDAITPEFKPYIYYLKNLRVVTGDTDNNFIPNGAVTRASMAVMLIKTLDSMKNGNSDPEVITPINPVNSSFTKINSVSGVIDKLYPMLNGIQIAYADKIILYQLSPNVSIQVNGYLKTFSDLREGMSVNGVLLNNELQSIEAETAILTSAPALAGHKAPTQTAGMSLVAGIVFSVTNDSIRINVSSVTADNQIVVENKNFSVANKCKVTRGGKPSSISDVAKGDVVKAEIFGGACYTLELSEKDYEIQNCVLLDKRMIADTPTLVVQDANGVNLALRVNEQTTVSRKDFYQPTWSDLRLGDSINAVCNLDTLVSVDAGGVKSSMDGVVKEVHVSPEKQTIILERKEGGDVGYTLIPETVDVYTIRVGMKVRLNLDSREVQSFSVLEHTNAPSSYTGVIQSLQNKALSLQIGGADSVGGEREILLNDATILIDSVSGKGLNAENLAVGMKVYVSLLPTGKAASYVTVLS